MVQSGIFLHIICVRPRHLEEILSFVYKGPLKALKSDCNTVHYKAKIGLRQANPRSHLRMLSYRGTKKNNLILRCRLLSIHGWLNSDYPGERVAPTAWVLVATSRYHNLNTGIALDGPQSGLTYRVQHNVFAVSIMHWVILESRHKNESRECLIFFPKNDTFTRCSGLHNCGRRSFILNLHQKLINREAWTHASVLPTVSKCGMS